MSVLLKCFYNVDDDVKRFPFTNFDSCLHTVCSKSAAFYEFRQQAAVDYGEHA